jgi:DNA adenine methylase
MIKQKNILEPVIKWSGSKRYVAPELSSHIIQGNRYFEPFVGGGSMLPFRKIENAIASDIISELIHLWDYIKNEPLLVATEYEKRWQRLQTEGHDVYYEIRDSFNATKNEFDFLFLTRTCASGLIRYNSNGKFNNSIHKNRPGINPKTFKEIILKWSYYLKNVTFQNTDYRETLSLAKKGDFVFLDPPYGGTKDRYTKTAFDLDCFYQELDRLNSVGANWILTFDGTAGNREYSFEVPKELYQHRISMKTGNSPFTKLMKTNVDAVMESVYFSFQPQLKTTHNLFEQSVQELELV